MFFLPTNVFFILIFLKIFGTRKKMRRAIDFSVIYVIFTWKRGKSCSIIKIMLNKSQIQILKILLSSFCFVFVWNVVCWFIYGYEFWREVGRLYQDFVELWPSLSGHFCTSLYWIQIFLKQVRMQMNIQLCMFLIKVKHYMM